jgi:hypothetical protein
MKVIGLAAALGLSGLASATTRAVADPWKDESGHGSWRYEDSEIGGRDHWRDRYSDRDYRYGHRDYGFRDHRPRRGRDRDAAIPPGHLPPPGECRTWYADRPAGHQPPPYRC